MTEESERNLGPQPIAAIIADRGLKAGDLVTASTQQITYKMVSRACKGRRLTPNVQVKIRDALCAAAGQTYAIKDLFTY
jgi:hypothetical protein